MRILLMGDHQIKSRSGYEWLMKAAQRKIEEKYGDLTENINMIMNIGDQVDVGTLDQYEQIHLFKSQLMSPYLPIMTAVGNHETYNDPHITTMRTLPTKVSAVARKTITLTKPAVSFSLFCPLNIPATPKKNG